MEQRTRESGPHQWKFGRLERRLAGHLAELLARAEKVTGMARLRLIELASIPLLFAILSACTVGPNYVRPKVETPPSFKEVEGWKKAEPQDNIPRGSWWTIYNDQQLNALEEQVNISNQNLAAAEAQYREALALVQVARAAYFPTVTAGPSASRLRTSANAPGSQGVSSTNSDYLLTGQVSWQPDLWGKVRRQVESSKASVQASDADLEGVRLSMHGQLAQDYFQLRTLDSQQQILTTTVENYKKFLALTKNRYAAGVAAQSDVLTAQTQLETAEAQLIDTGVQRAQMEHAIAVLMGKAPSDLTIPVTPLDLMPPDIPSGIPSELLERRPDIASAERQAAAANALIGVAIAAYYPNVTLSASGGFEATTLAQWFLWPSRFWTLGPAAVQETLFEGGSGMHRPNRPAQPMMPVWPLTARPCLRDFSRLKTTWPHFAFWSRRRSLRMPLPIRQKKMCL